MRPAGRQLAASGRSRRPVGGSWLPKSGLGECDLPKHPSDLPAHDSVVFYPGGSSVGGGAGWSDGTPRAFWLGMNATSAEVACQRTSTLAGRDARVALGTAWHKRALGHAFAHVLGAAVGVVFLVQAAPAFACSGFYAHNVAGAHAVVPANGGPLVFYQCQRGYPGCAWGDPITVLDDNGEEVSGTFVHHGEDYTFVPDEPLEVGAVYTIPEFGEVTAIEAVPVDLASIRVTVSLVEGGTLGDYERVCCEEARDTCGVYPCWRTSEVEETSTLTIVVQAEQRALETRRTEFRFSWTTNEDDGGQTDWAPASSAEQPLSRASSDYCVVTELRSLLTGETLTLPRVCLAHGSLGDPGETRTLPPDTDTADFGECPVPVEGYEEQWCAGKRAECAETESERSCSQVAKHCAAASESESESESESGSCAVNLAGARRSISWGWGLVALAFGWRARRRARHVA